MQRLKGIDQAGYFEPYYPNTAHTRFEHSLGVFHLLNIYNAPFEEQIAGLIHDVSHATFSHCIDYVLDVGSEKEHNHQDNIFKEFVKKTTIPSILSKYKLDPDYISEESNFPLKEKDLPDICADRIDYSLRTAIINNEIDQNKIRYFLDNLIVEDDQWVFKNSESAKKYAELFLKMNTKYYAGFESGVMFRTVGDCLRYSIKKGYIKEEDLYTTDNYILNLIKKHIKKDERLNLLFKRMNGETSFKNNPNDFDAHVFCKSRVVDPLFKKDGKIFRVSDIEPKWKKVVKNESSPKEYFIKFTC